MFHFFHSQMTLSIASWQPTFPSTTQSKHAFCLRQQTGSSQELFEHRRTRWGGCTSHAGHPELLQAPYRGIKPRSNYRLPTGTEGHFSTTAIVTTLVFISTRPPRAVVITRTIPISQETGGDGCWT